jgi:hypothetical protein
MGTIFVVTTLFAVLFGILTGVGAPGAFILSLAGFLAIIGFAQMLLFGGMGLPRSRQRRTASNSCSPTATDAVGHSNQPTNQADATQWSLRLCLPLAGSV